MQVGRLAGSGQLRSTASAMEYPACLPASLPLHSYLNPGRYFPILMSIVILLVSLMRHHRRRTHNTQNLHREVSSGLMFVFKLTSKQRIWYDRNQACKFEHKKMVNEGLDGHLTKHRYWYVLITC